MNKEKDNETIANLETNFQVMRGIYYVPWVEKIYSQSIDEALSLLIPLRIGNLINQYTEEEWQQLCLSCINQVKRLKRNEINYVHFINQARIILSPIIGANYHEKERLNSQKGGKLYDLFWKTKRPGN